MLTLLVAWKPSLRPDGKIAEPPMPTYVHDYQDVREAMIAARGLMKDTSVQSVAGVTPKKSILHWKFVREGPRVILTGRFGQVIE